MTRVWNTVFTLLREFEPLSHPRLDTGEGNGVVWGRPSPPARWSRHVRAARGARGATRGRADEVLAERAVVPESNPQPEVAPRWNTPAPARCCYSTSTIAFLRPGCEGVGPLYRPAVWDDRLGRDESGSVRVLAGRGKGGCI